MKTTATDFTYFKKQCEKWICKFGLTDWEVAFDHTDCNDGTLASCSANTEGQKIATLSLEKDWPNDVVNKESLSRTALHEVLHLLFSDLTCLCGKRFGITEYMLNQLEHSLLNRLEAVLLK